MTAMADLAFLLTVGVLVLTAEHLYALCGWACPGLLDKT